MKLYETITAENWKKESGIADGRMCLVNRLLNSGLRDRYYDLRAACEILFPDRSISVSAFNDHPDTTLDDVLRVCKLADV